jgi:hypothetical protein
MAFRSLYREPELDGGWERLKSLLHKQSLPPQAELSPRRRTLFV